MPKKIEIQWLKEPEEHDYPAAESYLGLHFEESMAKTLAEKLRHAPLSQFKAKDIFRASGLSLLGISNAHVDKDKKKIESGKQLSPVLLVRDGTHGRLLVADGYHRLCAVYFYDEDAIVPCKIV